MLLLLLLLAEPIDLLSLLRLLCCAGVIGLVKGGSCIGGLLLELLKWSCNAILFDDLFQLVLQVCV